MHLVNWAQTMLSHLSDKVIFETFFQVMWVSSLLLQPRLANLSGHEEENQVIL